MRAVSTTAPICLLTALWLGCGQGAAPRPTDAGAVLVTTEPETPVAASDPAPEPEPEPAGPPRRIFAKRFVANVRVAPDRAADRIGYLRAGAVLRATTAAPVGDEGCRGGWYELSTGGFVCGRRDVIAFDGQRLPEVRAAQPDREAKLPYQFGYGRRARIPVYRRLPTDEEAAEYEGYRIPGAVAAAPSPAPSPAEGGEAGPREATETEPEGPPPAPTADALAEVAPNSETPGGTATPEVPGTATPGAPPPAQPVAAEGDGPSDGDSSEGAPPVDAGPPTLASLMATPGEEGEETVLLRWMMRGFYVSLDREFRTGRRRYWRTQQNEYVPFHGLGLAQGSDFRGIVLGGEGPQLPVGYVMSRRTSSYERRDDGRIRRGPPPGYHHVFGIVGEEEIRGTTYYVAADGRLFRARDVTRIDAVPVPPEAQGEPKWIDVNLGNQTLVAYEGDRPVFVTLISSGRIRREDVPELNHETPSGVFRVKSKHLATTMDGDNAFDGPYSIQDVPYVMYYEQGYALHSAFWHNRFGRPKSHGCINLSPLDARWVFDWAGPALPAGWHGVYPTEDAPGTLIFIHGETPRG